MGNGSSSTFTMQDAMEKCKQDKERYDACFKRYDLMQARVLMRLSHRHWRRDVHIVTKSMRERERERD